MFRNVMCLINIKPLDYNEILTFAYDTSEKIPRKYTRESFDSMIKSGKYKNIVVYPRYKKAQIAGFVGLYVHDNLPQLKIFIRDEWRRKNIAKEALTHFTYNLSDRIYYQCFPNNFASKKLIESVEGFEYIGRLPRKCESGIEEVDTYVKEGK